MYSSYLPIRLAGASATPYMNIEGDPVVEMDLVVDPVKLAAARI